MGGDDLPSFLKKVLPASEYTLYEHQWYHLFLATQEVCFYITNVGVKTEGKFLCLLLCLRAWLSWLTLSQDDLQHMHDVMYTYSVVVHVMAGSQECT